MNNMPLTLQVPGVPKSHDCIRGSGVRFIEVTYFLSYPLNSYFFYYLLAQVHFQNEFSLLPLFAKAEWLQKDSFVKRSHESFTFNLALTKSLFSVHINALRIRKGLV